GPGVFYMNSPSGNTLHIYIIKLDSSGNFIWAKQIGGEVNSGAALRDLVVFDKYIYFIASFGGTIDVDPGAAIINRSPMGHPNALLIEKLDTAGNFIWAKQINGSAGGIKLATDSLSNLFICGAF